MRILQYLWHYISVPFEILGYYIRILAYNLNISSHKAIYATYHMGSLYTILNIYKLNFRNYGMYITLNWAMAEFVRNNVKWGKSPLFILSNKVGGHIVKVDTSNDYPGAYTLSFTYNNQLYSFDICKAITNKLAIKNKVYIAKTMYVRIFFISNGYYKITNGCTHFATSLQEDMLRWKDLKTY